MATQSHLLDLWTARKTSRRGFYRRREPRRQEFEYRGPRIGHPSNDAAVRFPCEPHDELAFESVARWPADRTPTYCAEVERAIGEAIIDRLMGAFNPHPGCRLSLTDIRWHPVSSSEVAVYRATVEAMRQLVAQADWTLTSNHAPH